MHCSLGVDDPIYINPLVQDREASCQLQAGTVPSFPEPQAVQLSSLPLQVGRWLLQATGGAPHWGPFGCGAEWIATAWGCGLHLVHTAIAALGDVSGPVRKLMAGNAFVETRVTPATIIHLHSSASQLLPPLQAPHPRRGA